MKRSTREEWAARVAKWKASGLAAKEFASEIGVRPGTLAWWKWRLGSSKPRPAPGSKRALLRKPPSPAAAAVTTVSPLAFIEMTAAVHVDPLEVVLPSRVRIRVPRGFDDVTLGRVLDVLEARR